MQQQKEEYGRRGIHLTYFEKGTSTAHFINLDEDPFRSHRFMYLLDKVCLILKCVWCKTLPGESNHVRVRFDIVPGRPNASFKRLSSIPGQFLQS